MERIANDLGISLRGVEVIEAKNPPKLEIDDIKEENRRMKGG